MTSRDPTPSDRSTRRRYLWAAGAGLAALAGCSSTEPPADNTEPESNQTPSESDSENDLSVSAETKEWATFGHNLQNHGSVDTVGPTEKPTEEWRVDTEHDSDGMLALSEGVIYAATGDAKSGVVYALSADDGREIWTYETGGLDGATPAIHDGTVYVGGREPDDTDGFSMEPTAAALYAIDAGSGELEWTFTTDDAFHLNAPPVIHNGRVYIGAETTVGSTQLFAIETASGEKAWSARLGDQVTSPALHTTRNTLFIGSSDNHLYALDADTGDERWRFDTGDFVLTEPSVWGNTVYVGNHGGLFAVNVETGDERWTYEGSAISSGHDTTQALTDEAVYTTMQSVLARVSHEGEERWRLDTLAGGGFSAPPLVTENMVYVASNDIRAHSVETGDEKWIVDSVSATGRPITSDGVLYVAGDEGIVALS